MTLAFNSPEILDLQRLREQSMKWANVPISPGGFVVLGYRAGEHVLVWVDDYMPHRYEIVVHACYREKIHSTWRVPARTMNFVQALGEAYRIGVAVAHLPGLEIFERVCDEVLGMKKETRNPLFAVVNQ